MRWHRAPHALTSSRPQDTVTYLHAIRPGVNRESHGLTVAALAGMPSGALDVARRTLDELGSAQAQP